MPSRYLAPDVRTFLAEFPAVVLIGPRQVGKTTLAQDIVKRLGADHAMYLDLELPSALRQLDDAEGFLLSHTHRLVVLDEVQRVPELFAVLRGVIDQRRRGGESAGQFLLLGSASGKLLGQTSESLAGRTATLELTPFQARELIPADAPAADTTAQLNQLWVRGGFPLSYLAGSDAASLRWRDAFIGTYLERDIPALGPRVPATTLRRLWTMLAHHQGQLLNQSQLAAALAINGQTVARYIDLLCDLMLVRRLPAWSGNVGKRLVRAPKVYVRDSGLVHALLGLRDLGSVLAHPVAGASWEGWVLEQLLAAAPAATASFYRTSHGAEADLVLNYPSGQTCVIEIKRSSAPTLSRGFHQAALDVQAQHRWLVAPVERSYNTKDGVQVMSPLQAVAALLAAF
jgi:predicted AAA+ superfamily ATPase